jgi:hypothetical protein
MNTNVVNCKVKYIRPKYNNLKEWMDDPNNIYIGRGGVVFIDNKRFPSNGSPFSNPFKDGPLEERIEKYRIYMSKKLKEDDTLVKALLQLKGKNLGCWCKPEKCHGDVLIELINEYLNLNI